MQIAIRTKASAHFVSALMGALVCVAVQRQFAAEVDRDFTSWPVDQFVVFGAAPFGIFLALFLGGHLLLSERMLGNTVIYSALGAGAALAAFFASAIGSTIPRAIETGWLSLLLAIVAGAGSLIGFLHVRSAGFAIEGDEPDALSVRLGLVKPPVQPASAAEATAIDGPVVSTGTAEYFDGPLQVATSGKAVVIGALIGGLVHAFWQAIVGMVFSGQSATELFGHFTDSEGAQLAGFSFLASIALCLVVLPPFIYAGHLFARGRKVTSIKDYAVLGAMIPVVVGLLIFIVGIFITYSFIVPMAAAMATYRKLAGLEPEGLPEDIEVKDRRTLIPADHARRKYRRVVG